MTDRIIAHHDWCASFTCLLNRCDCGADEANAELERSGKVMGQEIAEIIAGQQHDQG